MFSVIAPPSMQSVLRGLRSSQLYSQRRFLWCPAGLFPVATREFSTKLKPARDPERPKLPLTPYMLYLHQFRQSPPAGMNGLEVLRSAGQTWKSLGDHDKAPFMRTYQANKAVYTAEFEKYKASGKLEAWKRDPSRPKRPLTGYMRYAKEWRARHGSGLKVTEVTKKASVAWKSLPEDQQAIYNNAYKNEKAKYDAAMADYKASGKEQAFKEKLDSLQPNRKLLRKMKMKMKAAAVKEKAKMAKMKETKKMKAQKMKMQMKAMQSKKKMQMMKSREKAAMKMKKMKVAKAQKELRSLNGQAKRLSKLVDRANRVSMKMKTMKMKSPMKMKMMSMKMKNK